MITQEEKNQLSKAMITIWIIWGAVFSSLFVYIIVCHIVAQNMEPTMTEDFPLAMFTNILFAAGIIELVIAFFLKKIMLKNISGNTGQISGSQNAGQPMAIGKYIVVILILIAICDSIGIFGLVIFFMSQNFQLLYVFMTIAAISTLYFRPKKEELEALHEAMQEKEE